VAVAVKVCYPKDLMPPKPKRSNSAGSISEKSGSCDSEFFGPQKVFGLDSESSLWDRLDSTLRSKSSPEEVNSHQ
jgi:hypothetical protein